VRPDRPKRKPLTFASAQKMGHRHPPEERERLLAEFVRLRAEGLSGFSAARQVGVSWMTLRKWAKETELPFPRSPKKRELQSPSIAAPESPAPPARPRGRPRGRPRKRRPIADPPAGGLVIVTPQGQRIEGFTLADLLDALRALK
jgi:transposase-like protein